MHYLSRFLWVRISGRGSAEQFWINAFQADAPGSRKWRWSRDSEGDGSIWDLASHVPSPSSCSLRASLSGLSRSVNLSFFVAW